MKNLLTAALTLALYVAPVFTAYARAEETKTEVDVVWVTDKPHQGETIRRMAYYGEFRIIFIRTESHFDAMTIQAKGATGAQCQTSAASATPVIVLQCGNPQESIMVTRALDQLTVTHVRQDNSTLPIAPVAKVRT